MKEYQIRPLESSKSWEPFWQFLRAIGKGDSRIRKRQGGIFKQNLLLGVKSKAKETKRKEILTEAASNAPVRRSSRARTVKVMRDDSSSEEDAENFLDDKSENVFVKASTPKKLLMPKDRDGDSEIRSEIQEAFSQGSNDDQFKYLSSIIKRKPPSEFETEDFASSPPSLLKKVRY